MATDSRFGHVTKACNGMVLTSFFTTTLLRLPFLAKWRICALSALMLPWTTTAGIAGMVILTAKGCHRSSNSSGLPLTAFVLHRVRLLYRVSSASKSVSSASCLALPIYTARRLELHFQIFVFWPYFYLVFVLTRLSPVWIRRLPGRGAV